MKRYKYSIQERLMAAEYIMRLTGGFSTGEKDIQAVAVEPRSIIENLKRHRDKQLGCLARIRAAENILTQTKDGDGNGKK